MVRFEAWDLDKESEVVVGGGRRAEEIDVEALGARFEMGEHEARTRLAGWDPTRHCHLVVATLHLLAIGFREAAAMDVGYLYRREVVTIHAHGRETKQLCGTIEDLEPHRLYTTVVEWGAEQRLRLLGARYCRSHFYCTVHLDLGSLAQRDRVGCRRLEGACRTGARDHQHDSDPPEDPSVHHVSPHLW